uniref:TLDc domain-containing protein n=1 Tax=Trichogramma kaykai TaxID=54128 RepID=A0ABD2W842_9HYME
MGNNTSSRNKNGKRTAKPPSKLFLTDALNSQIEAAAAASVVSSSANNINGPSGSNQAISQQAAMSRSPSSAEILSSQFLPIDKLAKLFRFPKILSDITLREEGVNGISLQVFQQYLFPSYPELADRLFNFLHTSHSPTKSKHLGLSAFKQQTEKFLSHMFDQLVLEMYVKMFAENPGENEITPDGFRELLLVSYRLAMSENRNSSCPQLLNIINAVVVSCFHGKDSLSVNFVTNWMWNNCAGVVHGIHRYVVHVLTTAYRNSKTLLTKESSMHLSPSTPILDQPEWTDYAETILPISYVWLLASTLPDCYTQSEEDNKDKVQALIEKMSGMACPRHWTLLYNSNQHGCGSNRFLHHVLSYHGPTLTFIRAEGALDADRRTYPTYCICSSMEWRESHLYWGNEDSMVVELLPNYRVIQKGPKLLYLNTSIRGYPQGLRAGSDPRNPCVSIDQDFSSVSFAGVPYRLSSLEVWGCGNSKSKEKQLEIKKWQVKEAERQQVVKLSTSEWLDHPDRYLLEMGGRTNYNNSNC